jgi:hypothetical protein
MFHHGKRWRIFEFDHHVDTKREEPTWMCYHELLAAESKKKQGDVLMI